jgi:hypothetical protein
MIRAAFDVLVKRIAAENIPRHSLRNFLRGRVEIAIVLVGESRVGYLALGQRSSCMHESPSEQYFDLIDRAGD